MSEYNFIRALEKQFQLDRKDPNKYVGCAVEFYLHLLAAHLERGNDQETWYMINGNTHPVGKHWKLGWQAGYHTDFLVGRYTAADSTKIVTLESLFNRGMEQANASRN